MISSMTKHKSLLFFFFASILFLAVWIYLFNGLIYDDAYIAFRFSSNWATGHGPIWNVGENPVEGFSSFAWVLIGTIFQLVGILPHVIMPWVGVAAWLASALLLPKMIDAVNPGEHTRLDQAIKILTFLALIANAAIGFQAFHGLETSLFLLLILLFVYQALISHTTRDYIKLAVFSLFLITARPDGAAVILPIWALAFLLSPGERKNVLIGAFVSIGLIGLYSGAKWLYFGYPVPNTFYIKEATDGLAGESYVKDYLTLLSPLLIFLVYACGRLGLVRVITDKMFMFLITPSILFCVAYLGINPILGNVYRFLIPTLPLFILAGLRVYFLAKNQPEDLPRQKLRLSLGSEALLFFALALITINVFFNFKVYRDYAFLRYYSSATNENLKPHGIELKAANALSPVPLLATGDIGAIPYFSNLPTLDVIGLADETIAHQGLTHAYIQARKPDLLILQDVSVTKNTLLLECGPQGYDNPLVDVDGKKVSLNMNYYSKVLDDPASAHTGKGSTYQIFTTPNFTADYEFILAWKYGDGRYYVFVRRAYPKFDELVNILKTTK